MKFRGLQIPLFEASGLQIRWNREYDDKMIIDYIKVYQLKWDCNTDEEITRQSDLDNLDFAVKHSIDITSSAEPVRVRSTDQVTFRATDTFEITGPFQVDSGGEMTVIMQNCPD